MNTGISFSAKENRGVLEGWFFLQRITEFTPDIYPKRVTFLFLLSMPGIGHPAGEFLPGKS